MFRRTHGRETFAGRRQGTHREAVTNRAEGCAPVFCVRIHPRTFQDGLPVNSPTVKSFQFFSKTGGDNVTLITRPRRFEKTLSISMLEDFFSVNYADRIDIFQGLKIWENEKYRKLQSTCPVLFLSFADIKETSEPPERKRLSHRRPKTPNLLIIEALHYSQDRKEK